MGKPGNHHKRYGARRTGGSATRRARRLGCEQLESRTLLAFLEVGAGAEFTSIQAAVDHARPDDVILIEAGTYPESVDLSRMGIAFSGSTGSVTIRGLSTADVVVSPPSGPALLNSAPWIGDVTIEHITINSPLGAGIDLQNLQGRVEVVDTVFADIAATGLELTEFSGEFSVSDSEFSNVGQGAGNHAIHLAGLEGRGSIARNTIDNAADTAVLLENGGSHEASVMIGENTIRGDSVFFSTTECGVRALLTGDAQTDLTIDNNQLQDLATAAVDVEVGDRAWLQTRWSRTVAGNINGPWAMRLQVDGTAEVAATLSQNSVLDTAEDGLIVEVHGAGCLDAVMWDNLFMSIGAGADADALTIATAADSTGTVDVRVQGNTFETVAGVGGHLLADGAGEVTASVTDNYFNEVNVLGGAAACLLEQAGADSQAAIHLQLHDNTVLASAADAYALHRRGGGDFRLEGTGGDAATSVGETNTGGPVTVSGTVTVVTPGTFDEMIPLRLGGRVWQDAVGDGVRDSDEQPVAAALLTLAGSAVGPVQRITQTDAAGQYEFTGLHAGAYTVAIELDLGYWLTQPDAGGDDTRDSDFDPLAHQTAVTLDAGNDDLSVDAGLVTGWYNIPRPLDVNDDTLITPLDVLLIINDLNSLGPRSLPMPPTAPTLPPPYVDVNGDGVVAPLDVLLVINFLNARSAGAGEAEGESAEPVWAAILQAATTEELRSLHDVPASLDNPQAWCRRLRRV
jgi:hypothetical protein